MDAAWPHEFRERMLRFEGRRDARRGEAAVSLKIRVSSGCFHREHSPRAYEVIDQSLNRLAPDIGFVFEEHESGPEILAYVGLATAGVSLAAALIDLAAAIIKARAEGIRKGDNPSAPLQMIVRRVHDKDGFREEQVLTVGPRDNFDESHLREQLTAALSRLLDENAPSAPKKSPTPKPAKKKASRKKQR